MFYISICTMSAYASQNSSGFPGGSEVKASACNAGDQFDPWVRKIPWRRKWQPTPVFLPGESQGQRSLVGSSPQGHKESDMTERLHFHFCTWTLVYFMAINHTLTRYKKNKIKSKARKIAGWGGLQNLCSLVLIFSFS